MWRAATDHQHLVVEQDRILQDHSDAADATDAADAADTMTAVGFKGEKEPTVDGGRLTWNLMISVIASLCGMFTFGYNTGVINSPKTDIKNFINSVYLSRYGQAADDALAESLFSYIVAAFALGGLVSGPLAGLLAEGLGRKGGLLLISAVGVVASLLLGFANLAASHEMLLVGRFLIGACSGLFTSLSPMYISEVAPLAMRGALGVCNQLSVTIALLVAQLLGADFGLQRWDVLLGISAVPCVVLLALLPLCPESPRFLLASGRVDAAENALSWLRAAPASHVHAEVQAMKDEEEGAEPAMGFLQLVRNSSLRKPLLVAAVLQLSQQLSGINGVLYYSTDVFTKAGLDESTSKLATVGTGGIMVLMTLVSTQFVDRLGRRALLLLGLVGMFVSSLAVTATLGLANEGAVVRALAVVSVLAFVVLFSLGPGSIPWLITAELFSQGPRPAAMACSVTVNWAANLVVSLAFPPMQVALGYLVFAPFSVLLFFFSLFTALRVPETKNKTFREIADSFR